MEKGQRRKKEEIWGKRKEQSRMEMKIRKGKEQRRKRTSGNRGIRVEISTRSVKSK